MKINKIAYAVFGVSLAVLSTSIALSQSPASAPGGTGPYRVSWTFQVGGDGGWDYLTVDSEHKLLYVPRSTHTMVLDAATGKTVADIPGQKRNHGVAIVPSAGRGFITDGNDASVTVFDLKTYAVLGKIKTEPDSDGIIYDPASDKVLVVCGDPGLLIPISPNVDLAAGKADASVDLGGKPEFLAADGKGRAYINLVDKDQVAVVDTKTMKVINKWPTTPGGSPVGMSMDTAKRRLFIGCRKPQKLIVMSADDGKILADLPIGAGVDAVKFDGDVFASCGDGTLTVTRETNPGQFEVVQTVPTPRGARTMGVDPATHMLYLPTAEFEPQVAGQTRPRPKPGTFMIVVVSR
ncbi:MAG TPA: YncE family protein [Verrucomicrobiae bacterium]|jgi:DNA-binding beta-propeller fold protein YncE|nr:YncE family protein [Verrucomicrobiae bacterium]